MNPFLDAFVTALVYRDQDQLRHLLSLDLAKTLPQEMVEEAQAVLADSEYEVPPYILDVIDQTENNNRLRGEDNALPKTRY